ncbi:MAG: permease [Caldilineae bacterium]|nr:permease [Anaerolineae bacterium]MCB0253666.1 permease [Anaerolineae bacterium]MCB9154327.1 permease [Caldilineae bacterium]
MDLNVVLERLQVFVTIFLGIFIEAVPFLLAGSVVAGLIEIFLGRETLHRIVPHQPILAALAGTSMGMVFPVCECGVVPVTRRLYGKGLALPVGIAFLMAAPVINPVVMLSTYAAFGWSPILVGRIAFTFVIAFSIGLIFQLARRDEVLLPTTEHPEDAMDEPPAVSSGEHPTIRQRLPSALRVAGDDFLDMTRYLVIGCLLAAAMQTLIPQSTLTAIGQGPVTSVIVMLALAFVLSVCSTVDAFVALAFVGTFTPASILAFLVFGPMVDIKSTAMFLGVFQRRKVAYLVLLPFVMALFLGVFLNFNVGVLR